MRDEFRPVLHGLATVAGLFLLAVTFLFSLPVIAESLDVWDQKVKCWYHPEQTQCKKEVER